VTHPLVTIGRVVKAHGIRGEVAVDVQTDLPDRFDDGTTVVLGGSPRVIESSRPHQGRLLVRFEGVHDRTQAELLRGRLIEAEPRELEDTDHYFVHELVGMRVVLDERDLGEVSALIELPPAAGYDLLEVRRDDGTTWLLPAVDDQVEVEETDGGGHRLRLLDPPEGLIDGEPEVVRPPDPSGPQRAGASDPTGEAPGVDADESPGDSSGDSSGDSA
jgi:16S rRNA processing protein RimM